MRVPTPRSDLEQLVPDEAACPPAGGAETERRLSIWAALGGWTLAVALAAASGGRDPSTILDLGAALLWWPVVLVVIRSDIRDFLIPDEASAAIAGLGLLRVLGQAILAGEGLGGAVSDAAAAVAAAAVALALFWLVGWSFRRFARRHALGFGDVKLAAACAVWLTPGDAALALEIAAVGAIAVLLVARRRGGPAAERLRDTAVPFGAFLAPAAWAVFVLGPAVHGAIGS